MKKIILSAAAVFAFGFANAQDATTSTGAKGFANGDVFITGAVSFSSTKQDEAKSNTFEINPMVGFFVTENIALGGSVGYTSMKAEFDGTDTQDETELSVGVFGRYYATPASDFSIFGHLGFDYFTSEDNMDEFKTNGFEIALRPGINYFVSEKFALEAMIGSLGYRTEKADVDGAEAQNTFGLELDMRSISLGVLYKF